MQMSQCFLSSPCSFSFSSGVWCQHSALAMRNPSRPWGPRGYLSLCTPSPIPNSRKIMSSLPLKELEVILKVVGQNVFEQPSFFISHPCAQFWNGSTSKIFLFCYFHFYFFGWNSFLSKEGNRKAVLYVSDGGNLLSVIELKTTAYILQLLCISTPSWRAGLGLE